MKTITRTESIAGSDTTAGAIRGTLLHIMTNPRVYAKLQREVDDAVRDGLSPSTLPPRIRTCHTCRLLSAKGCESGRPLLTSSRAMSRQVVILLLLTMKACSYRGGTCIGYSAYAMHQNEDI